MNGDYYSNGGLYHHGHTANRRIRWSIVLPLALTVWSVIDSVFGNEQTDDTWQDDLPD